MTGRALVLGGGGITGIAWELGILTGLQEAGTDLTDADVIVGTSAGSAVGAQITSATPLSELFTRQLRPVRGEAATRVPVSAMARIAWAVLGERAPDRGRARIGRVAHSTARSSLDDRDRVTRRRLPSHTWPEADLRIATVNARTGRRAVLRRGGSATLVEAVNASCAVPGVWPPVPIGDALYIDGGVYSSANVDLVAGYERVVVLAPIARGLGPVVSPGDEMSQLPDNPRTTLVTPGRDALAAIGRNRLDPTRRAPSAEAGRVQAAEVHNSVARVWGE